MHPNKVAVQIQTIGSSFFLLGGSADEKHLLGHVGLFPRLCCSGQKILLCCARVPKCFDNVRQTLCRRHVHATVFGSMWLEAVSQKFVQFVVIFVVI
jgi:hypothetical protein